MLVALDAQTGKEVWTAEVADNKNGYYMSLAPLVADGKVMVGTSGGEIGHPRLRRGVRRRDRQGSVEGSTRFRRPASRAARRGRKGDQWKTGGAIGLGDRPTTIPRHTSRSGAPATAVRGWAISGPATISTPRRRLPSTCATGTIKGHHQYHPNDSWDWDEVSPPILVDFKRDGRTVKGLIDVARDGYLWFLERTDGEINFVEGMPYVKQNGVQEPRSEDRPARRRSGTQARHRQSGRRILLRRTGAARTGRRSRSIPRRG